MSNILKNIKAVVLDLDDTLYLERDFSFSGFSYLENKHAIENFSSQAKDTYLNESTKNIFNIVFSKLNRNLPPELLSLLIKDFREHIPTIKLCDDSVLFLQFLREKKIHIGIITDGFRISQKNKIKALNLESSVDYIIITDELSDTDSREFWKPHPLAYIKMEEKFQVKPEECIYIGDNLSKDFITPQQRGWKHLLITRDEAVHKSQHENFLNQKVKKLSELIY